MASWQRTGKSNTAGLQDTKTSINAKRKAEVELMRHWAATRSKQTNEWEGSSERGEALLEDFAKVRPKPSGEALHCKTELQIRYSTKA
jgi:hypothetical protein